MLFVSAGSTRTGAQNIDTESVRCRVMKPHTSRNEGGNLLDDAQRIVEGQYVVYHMVLSNQRPSIVNGLWSGASRAKST